MIISALASYYEQLLRDRPDEIARPGWTLRKVNSYLLLAPTGEVKTIVPVGVDGSKDELVPEQADRTGTKPPPYFLCDKPQYYLPPSTELANRGRFDAAAELHLSILKEVDSPLAKAISAYFSTAESQDAAAFASNVEKNDWLLFAMINDDGEILLPTQDSRIVEAWDRYRRNSAVDGALLMGAQKNRAMICLASGERGAPAKKHPVINGVRGAGTNAKLICFDKDSEAFSSYGYDGQQGRNASVGESTAQAYGAALNYLLSNRTHNLRIGDTTVVFWSEHADQGNADLFSLLLGGMPFDKQRSGSANEGDLHAALSALHVGKLPDLEGIDFDSPFYVLGLAPNKARLAVRFFLMDNFGKMLRSVEAHYRRIRVARAASDKEVLTPYWLLRAVENVESKNPVVTSELAAPLLRAILTNARYPEALYSNCLLRVKANRDVTYAQAAIIKSYLIRNCNRSEDQVTEELNEKRNDVAYALGRAFALLGQIQQVANGKDTLTGSYLDAACSRPAVAFPSLLRLSSAHLAKIAKDKRGWAISLERDLSESLSQEKVAAFPKHLSLPEQGDFMLGYYHQKANRYQKKSESIVNENTNNEEA